MTNPSHWKPGESGNPTKYNEQTVSKVEEYLKGTGREKTALPTINGLALFLDVHRDTIHQWKKDHPEFAHAVDRLMDKQAEQLINDGIYGGKEVNSTIVKLLLMNNHGMRERQDVTSENEKIIGPTVFIPKETDG